VLPVGQQSSLAMTLPMMSH